MKKPNIEVSGLVFVHEEDRYVSKLGNINLIAYEHDSITSAGNPAVAWVVRAQVSSMSELGSSCEHWTLRDAILATLRNISEDIEEIENDIETAKNSLKGFLNA